MCGLMICAAGVTHQRVDIIYQPGGIALFGEKNEFKETVKARIWVTRPDRLLPLIQFFIISSKQVKGPQFNLSKFSPESLKIIVVGWNVKV